MPITDSEKARRRALLKTHYDVENSHDMNGIMATFSPDAEMLYNRMPFTDQQSIRDAHVIVGFSGTGGAFETFTTISTTNISQRTKSSSRDACVANMSVNSKALNPRAATSNCRSSPFITSTRPTNSSPNA